MGLRIAVNAIVDPSDENIIPLVGQMDFVIPVHVLVAQGRRQIVKNDSFRKTFLNLKKKRRISDLYKIMTTMEAW